MISCKTSATLVLPPTDHLITFETLQKSRAVDPLSVWRLLLVGLHNPLLGESSGKLGRELAVTIIQ